MGNGWVLFGYAMTYGTIAAYVALIVVRTRTLRRRLDR